jgi:predicted small metal-binding protein
MSVYRVSGADLGIANCDFVAEGETPADVVAQMVDHLRSEHDIDMPDTETIMSDDFDLDMLFKDRDEGARLVVDRLREELNVTPSEPTTPIDRVAKGRWKQ